MLNNSLLRKFSTIRLTEQESKVFTILLEASESMGKGSILRAAGGWVRDKLMGNESCDIDIALDNVPGDEFAFFVHEQEKSKGHCSSIGVVKENPDQSKHIRTASFRLLGIDLDINNLRSEKYTENSRIPEVQFARHPSEDALRRDFTINALYYNLNTREVEDYTGTGLTDLERGIIRTPLPASRTFVDDPLRVLRAIRFVCRFGFKLDGDICAAWTETTVREGLMNKVSRERIGVEITKMMKDKNAIAAVQLLHSSGLLDLVISTPSNPDAPSLVGTSKKDYTAWKEVSINTSASIEEIIANLTQCTIEDKMMMNFALLFHTVSASNMALVVRLSMKVPNEICRSVAVLLEHQAAIRAVVELIESTPSQKDTTVIALGRLIRTTLKSQWKDAVALCLAIRGPIGQVRHSDIIDLAESHNLSNCYEWKPVIDGIEIQKIFSIPPSRRIQELLLAEFELMFTGVLDRDQIIVELCKLVSK